MIIYVLAQSLLDRTWSYQQPGFLGYEYEMIVSVTPDGASYCAVEFSYY